jgi:hypothetical protein
MRASLVFPAHPLPDGSAQRVAWLIQVNETFQNHIHMSFILTSIGPYLLEIVARA